MLASQLGIINLTEGWYTETVRETRGDLQSPYPDSKGIMSHLMNKGDCVWTLWVCEVNREVWNLSGRMIRSQDRVGNTVTRLRWLIWGWA